MKNNLFEIEWQNTLKQLKEKNANLKEFEYFLNMAEKYSDFYNKKNGSKVVLLGLQFPDEIIRAMGIDFCYVFGGSYESTMPKSVNLPKDVDDETKSVLGIIDDLELSKDDVLLIPLCNDNNKKLKALVSDSTTVICYEVPADRESRVQKERFAYEIERVTAELKKHFKKKLSSFKLKEECNISKKAAETFERFESVYKDKKTVLTASGFAFTANTYYMCNDREEWIYHLECLINELEEKRNFDYKSCPEIMLLGSPIYAPNYKILFTVEDIDIKLHTIITPYIEHIKAAKDFDIKSVCAKYLSVGYIESDISPVYITNSGMKELVTNAINSGNVKGVIICLLKGHIEYDYECGNVEKFITDCKIPVNKIETVYSYQDIEQIRLKLQAFSEMICT